MKKVTGGNGSDTTTATLNKLKTTDNLWMPTLYRIGEADWPYALWLTDYESPLTYSLFSKPFLPGTGLKRSDVQSKFGLEVQTMDLEWSPPVGSFVSQLQATSPYAQVRLGWFDGLPFYAYTCYMFTRGDADTYGCSELFGGTIGKASLTRGKIKFTIDSFLSVVNQKVPAAVIEQQNSVAQSRGATPPAGAASVPQFNVITTSTAQVIVGDATSPTAHQIFADNALQNGFVVFNSPIGNTLGRAWASIASNKRVTISGTDYNQITLYAPLPWAPTPGTDTFYASAAYPINQSDGSYYGFPFVPAPENAI